MNLVINAGEAMPQKTDGFIDVSTGCEEISAAMARSRTRYDVSPGLYVWLEVRDSGAGMDDATLSRIFDPFFTTKFTGRGLGLAAVEGIVRSSKGFIDVRSQPGAGTTFRVFLPASANVRTADFSKPVERSRQQHQQRGSCTVLVVDDEEMVRELASIILRRHGYEVRQAVDGKHALQLIAESGSPPAVVLLDLAMPVMGGDELLPILKERYPALKIIVSSGYAEEEARNRFSETSVAGVLQKPYSPVALTSKIEEVLGGRPPQSGQLVQFPKVG
jgi:CheY-like chemotaxis protein